MQPMTRRYERALIEVIRLMDVLSIFVSFYLAYSIRAGDWFPALLNTWLGQYLQQPLQTGFHIEKAEQILWIIVPAWLILLSYTNTYYFDRTATFMMAIKSIFKVHIIGSLLLGTFIFFTNSFQYRRTFFFLFVAFSFMLTLLVRFVFHFGIRMARASGRNRNRTVVIGNGEKALKVLVELSNHKYWGFTIQGLITEKPVGEEMILGLPVLGSVAEVERILRKTPVDDVFVAVDQGKNMELKDILKICENIGVTVHLLPDKYDLEIARSSVGSLGALDFVTFFTVLDNPTQRAMKRLMDIAISLLLSPILVASFIVVGILIKLDSPGPVIYRSTRLTRNRRTFVFYKFRTMVEGAEEVFEFVSHRNSLKGPIIKIKDDPRVTRVGKWLRRFSIDELPQIVNVLLGDMSLVGPRPPLPEEVDLYTLPQMRKLSMQQGLTGLWQVNGRDDIVRFEDRLKMDLQYIDNWSLWLDVKIMLKTMFVVFKGAL